MNPDEGAVLAAMDALDEALDRRDPEAVAALFSDVPGMTFWGSAMSEEALSHADIRRLLASAEASSGVFTLNYDDRRVTIRGDVAWVNASGRAKWERPGHDTVKMPYRLTAIFTKDGDVWRWHTHHGSSPDDG
jgi:ketosteroid isomerase-like protein